MFQRDNEATEARTIIGRHISILSFKRLNVKTNLLYWSKRNKHIVNIFINYFLNNIFSYSFPQISFSFCSDVSFYHQRTDSRYTGKQGNHFVIDIDPYTCLLYFQKERLFWISQWVLSCKFREQVPLRI